MPNKWEDKSYAVGKGKPPVHTRFGQEGRPPGRGGRRAGAKNADTVIKAHLSAKIKIKDGGKERQISKLDAIVTQLVNSAAKGDLKAIDMILRINRDIEARTPPEHTALPLAEADRAILEQFAQHWRNGEGGQS